ncbi:hypothetical protein CHUAL_013529 [Chamberlinius hualienensis]
MDSLKLPLPNRATSMGSADFGEVAALVTSYTDYLQALTGLCSRGVQLIRNFVGPCSVAYMLPTKEREEAQKLWAIWEDINKSMQQTVWSVRTQSVQSLQDWLQQKSKEKLAESSKTSDDLSKLITACLIAVTQLQYQFSALCCNAFMDLEMVKTDDSGLCEVGAAFQLVCDTDVDKERRDSGNVSEDLTLGNGADPLLLQMQLGRRSSYELGNLHTVSPPLPSTNSLGRRWSMPTEDIVLNDNKVSPQFNGGMGKKRETLVSHEELDSIINLLSFSGGTAPPNRSSNNSGKSLSPASKLDPLTLPKPSRCSQNRYNGHPRHDMSTESRSWSSTKTCVPSNGGGLLTVVSMVSPNCQESKLSVNRSNFDVHQASTPQHVMSVGTTAAPGGMNEIVNNEGAFSIGLNLVGSDLMATVKQKQSEEPPTSNLPQFKVPEMNSKHIRVQPAMESGWNCGDPSYKESDIQSAAEFLPFSMEASPGPNIWTPSQNDYNSSASPGSYFFQAGQ